VDGERENAQQAMRFAATWLNPLVCKIPLFRPDRFFTAVEPKVRFALGWWGFVVWALVVLAGAAQVGMEWPQFSADTQGILARDNWLWLFLAWAGLKVAHEFSHGAFCKHFGAAVREAGAILVLFVPMGFVDATASLGLASRARRIMVSAAGIYLEFFIAALAAVVWAKTEPGTVHNVAHNVDLSGRAGQDFRFPQGSRGA
jgi:putative peptide zinc metalloprotease protein